METGAGEASKTAPAQGQGEPKVWEHRTPRRVVAVHCAPHTHSQFPRANRSAAGRQYSSPTMEVVSIMSPPLVALRGGRR